MKNPEKQKRQTVDKRNKRQNTTKKPLTKHRQTKTKRKKERDKEGRK